MPSLCDTSPDWCHLHVTLPVDLLIWSCCQWTRTRLTVVGSSPANLAIVTNWAPFTMLAFCVVSAILKMIKKLQLLITYDYIVSIKLPLTFLQSTDQWFDISYHSSSLSTWLKSTTYYSIQGFDNNYTSKLLITGRDGWLRGGLAEWVGLLQLLPTKRPSRQTHHRPCSVCVRSEKLCFHEKLKLFLLIQVCENIVAY